MEHNQVFSLLPEEISRETITMLIDIKANVYATMVAQSDILARLKNTDAEKEFVDITELSTKMRVALLKQLAETYAPTTSSGATVSKAPGKKPMEF